MEIIPKTSREVQDDRRVIAPQQSINRWQRRELELVTQKVLLERLRYKYYVRHGTLASVIQTLGDFARSKRLQWAFWFLAYLYLMRRFHFLGL